PRPHPCVGRRGAATRKEKRKNVMSFLIDEVARIVASPMPRRKALKLLGSALSGAILATLSVGRAKAQCSTCSGKCNANSPCEAQCAQCCCGPNGTCIVGIPCGGHGCPTRNLHPT